MPPCRTKPTARSGACPPRRGGHSASEPSPWSSQGASHGPRSPRVRVRACSCATRLAGVLSAAHTAARRRKELPPSWRTNTSDDDHGGNGRRHATRPHRHINPIRGSGTRIRFRRRSTCCLGSPSTFPRARCGACAPRTPAHAEPIPAPIRPSSTSCSPESARGSPTAVSRLPRAPTARACRRLARSWPRSSTWQPVSWASTSRRCCTRSWCPTTPGVSSAGRPCGRSAPGAALGACPPAGAGGAAPRRWWGWGALGLLLCCLLSVVEAIAAFLVQHPH